MKKSPSKAALLCGLLLVGLVGCSDDDNDDNQQGNNGSGNEGTPTEEVTRLQDGRTFAVGHSETVQS